MQKRKNLTNSSMNNYTNILCNESWFVYNLSTVDFICLGSIGFYELKVDSTQISVRF